jgi:hypothetical protein
VPKTSSFSAHLKTNLATVRCHFVKKYYAKLEEKSLGENFITEKQVLVK